MVLNLWLLVCECICVWADQPGDRGTVFWFPRNICFGSVRTVCILIVLADPYEMFF